MADTQPPLDDAPPPYDTIVFDCDSTLASIEGIDELARGFAGRGSDAAIQELARLTNAAMDGQLALEEVYGKRLDVVRPSRADLETVGQLYIDHALPGTFELVAALLHLGKRVRIVSGGILQAVRPFGRALGLVDADVQAVAVHFDDDGGYAGFDQASPLARSGGKIQVVESLRVELEANAMALIGDGATDLEAGHLVERFIAYGGVARRERVFAGARVHCESADFRDLARLLLSPPEIARLGQSEEHAPFVNSLPA